MSSLPEPVSIPIRDFYTEIYPNYSVEELQAYFDERKLQREKFQKEKQTSRSPLNCCAWISTSRSATDIISRYAKPLCSECVHYAKMKEDPTLVLVSMENFLDLIQCAIYSKQKGYDKLSVEKLEQEMKDVYEYGRYMRRCETDFSWRDEGIPEGLSESMYENEQEQNALEFELKYRDLIKQDTA